MSYLVNKIKRKLKKYLALTDKKSRDIFRDRVDLFVSLKEKSIDDSRIMEAGIELGIIDFVIYNDKKYPVRTLVLTEKDDDTLHEFKIASEELFFAYGEEINDWDLEAQHIDSEIYFYLEPSAFVLPGKEIAEKHLDIAFKFISEEIATTV